MDIIHYWTDSSNVLCWLNNETRDLMTFVAVMSLSLSVTESGNTCVLFECLFKAEKRVEREREHKLEI